MKAAFKLGTLIKYNENKFGEVDAIITRQNGYTYVVAGEEVEAESIVAAYAPIKARTTGTRKKRATRSKKETVKLNRENAMN